MTEIDVHPRDLDMVIGILARYIPDREVRVMGSRLTGGAKSFSDLDLVIMGREPLSLGARGDLRDAFDDSSLPFTVDLVEWATSRRTCGAAPLAVGCSTSPSWTF